MTQSELASAAMKRRRLVALAQRPERDMSDADFDEDTARIAGIAGAAAARAAIRASQHELDSARPKPPGTFDDAIKVGKYIGAGLAALVGLLAALNELIKSIK